MRFDLLIKDPVFQLNLLIWASLEQPGMGHRVFPFFYQLGYTFLSIDNHFEIPPSIAMQFRDIDLKIKISPVPELILKKEDEQKALYFEAKSGSFSSTSTNCDQARGHLIACGDSFGLVYPTVPNCLLCYILPDCDRELMSVTLSELRAGLIENKLSVGTYCIQGLKTELPYLKLCLCEVSQKFLAQSESEVVLLENLSEDTNPTPLLLIYSDQDHHDPHMRDFYRRALIEQVRAALICALEPHPVGAVFYATAESLLDITTRGSFQYLGVARRKDMSKLIRQNVFRKIDSYWKNRQRGIVYRNNQLGISWDVPGQKEDFLNWLEDKRTVFEASRADEEYIGISEPDLFEEEANLSGGTAQ